MQYNRQRRKMIRKAESRREPLRSSRPVPLSSALRGSVTMYWSLSPWSLKQLASEGPWLPLMLFPGCPPASRLSPDEYDMRWKMAFQICPGLSLHNWFNLSFSSMKATWAVQCWGLQGDSQVPLVISTQHIFKVCSLWCLYLKIWTTYLPVLYYLK